MEKEEMREKRDRISGLREDFLSKEDCERKEKKRKIDITL